MSIGNFEFDLAEQRAEEEREAEIRRARASLSRRGQDECEDCPQPISAARRRAMPSATRCIRCQEAFEKEERRLR